MMNIKMILGLAATANLMVTGCGKKSASTDTATSNGGTSGVPAAGQTASVGSLALVPDADSFLKSKDSSASLTAALMLADRGDGYNLITGTPPKFTDIAPDLASYLTGDVTALAKTIDADRTSNGWADMKTKVSNFFDAETKCGIMEHSARMIARLREDTAPLCLLKATGAIGDKVYKVVSGAAIDDLTKIFQPSAADKVLQIGLTDRGQPHYEIVQISGSTSSPDNYHVVYSTCATATKKAFRQNTVDINNKTGVMTFTSYKNGAVDDKGPKPNASFSLTGSVVSDGAGGMVPDTSKSRSIAYNGAGTFGQLASSEQGSLTISNNELTGVFFASETGTDANANTTTRTDKTALDVQYAGSETKDLVVYQGAGRSVMSMTGSINGSTVTNTNDHKVGFSFDSSASPKFTTATSSTYLTNVAAVDFTTDAVLKQTAPTAPDMDKIDSTACSATPTTVLNYVDRPEENGAFAAAMDSCNTFPAAKSANMCDALRNQEHTVNQGMQQRKQAVANPGNY